MKKIFKAILFALCLCLGLTALAGCEAKFDLEKPITVVVRGELSGTRTAFMEIIGLKGKADVANAIETGSTAAVLAKVKSDAQSIGYESLGYVSNDVKALKIDGVECTVANIKSGTYKIARPLSVVYKENTIAEGSLYKHFYNFLMSKDAQAIISEEGYVSLYDSAADYVKPVGLSGTIKISGSTSLEPLMKILRDKFVEFHGGVTVEVAGGGSGTGYANAENGTSHFGMISEEFAQTKAENCTFGVVAKDGIAVIVNKENSFDNLSLIQLKNIYDKDAETKFIKWSDIK